MKRFIKAGLLLQVILLILLVLPVPAQAQQTLTIEMFWGEGCPHCAKAKPFLQEFTDSEPGINLVMYEVYNDQDNYIMMLDRVESRGISDFGVPLIFIGDEHVIGYGSDDTSGELIKSIAYNQLAKLSDDTTSYPDSHTDDETVSVPVLNEVNVRDVSLPLLAVVLGAVDGFNPCALWALLFLISLLINTEDKRKLLVLGSLFILTSGIVYFLFMTAWFNLFQFLGLIPIVRYAVGLVALLAAVYNLREWWRKRDGGCEKGDKAQRSGIFNKAKDIVASKNMLLAAGGIIVLAVSVNMIELMCSAGLPAIFTHVLSLNDLELWQYYGLMSLYILFFMVDDLIIFIVAVFTFEVVGISSKYSNWSRIIGGILMLIIGLLLIFKPEWLQFG